MSDLTVHIDGTSEVVLGGLNTDQVRYFERFSVSDDGQTLSYSITVGDPVVFAQPFTMDRTRQALPGHEIEPSDCVLDWQDVAG